MSDLGELLEGGTESTVEAPAETVESVESTETVATETTETPAEDTTGLNDGLPPSDNLAQDVEAIKKELNAYKVKARDEKAKRQELEKRELPDVLDDQKGFAEGVTQDAGLTVSHKLANQSEFLIRRELGSDKVDAAFLKYQDLIADNPALQSQVADSPAPWHTMMDVVDQAEKLQQINDPNFMQKKEAEIEAKVRAKIEAEAKAKADKTANLSPSLSSESSEPISENNWTGPTPLNSILA